MTLYHYITKGNSALTEGILSFAKKYARFEKHKLNML